MSPSRTPVDQISVHIAFHDTPLVFPIRDNTVVEDIIVAVCKQLRISPVTRPLFALKNSALGQNAWLSMAQNFNDDKIRNYEFAMRFKVPHLDYIMAIDRHTYNFYYKQVRHNVLHSLIPTLNLKQNESRVIGLCVTDMIRAIVEDGLSKSEVIRNYRKYVPTRIQKKHPFFLKKPIKLKIEEVRIKSLDAYYLKMSYLELFNLLAPDYLVEEYSALSVYPGDRLYTTIIRVDPFSTLQPGITKKDEHREWEHVCSIDDLCFMSTAPTGMVEIWRKNGICVTFKFPMATDIVSFATLLDGYYRLTCKWTFNLCKNLQTPSLLRLFALKCHGPVGDPFSYKKLFEKMEYEVGSFLLRESSVEYDSWFIDVCLEPGKGPTTLKITRTNDGRYQLSGEEETYSSLSSLIQSHRTGKTDIRLSICLPPSEYDISILLLCRTEDHESDGVKEDKPSIEPVCIDAKTLTMQRNKPNPQASHYAATLPRKGRSTCTTVCAGTWKTAKGEVKNVAIKILHADEIHSLMPEFCAHSKWSFMNTNSTIRIFGMTLANPISMVMEYAPLGPLDEYLANPQQPVTDLNLLEAAASLANALYYLAESKYVHGYIRCCKVLVMAHTDLSLSVRLAHPGLTVPYIDYDLHWIPPEFHEEPLLAYQNETSDIWAYATTLWEIFSCGILPEIRAGKDIKRFYLEPTNYLVRPKRCQRAVYELMLNCWERDPDTRTTAQGVMRDINHIYYQMHNAKSYHPYSLIPFQKSDFDSVSNGSKTSGDYNASVLSALTQNTLLDDGDESGSDDFGFHLPRKAGSGSYCTLPTRTGLISQLEQNVLRKLEQQKAADLEQEELPRPIVPSTDFDLDERFDLDKDWQVVKKGLIGEGYYGEVFRADLNAHYDNKLTKQCVVKQLKADFFASTLELQKELQIMSKLDHPNIVKLIGFIQDPHPLLVLEYLERGSLKNHIIVHSAWTDTIQLMKWALNIAMGMRYLHEHTIIHRDLSARNILVDENCVKIADFGLARFLGDQNYYYYQRPNRVLPIKWYAPESISSSKFSYQSDVWSYGVTLWEMFSPNAEPDLPEVGNKTTDIIDALNRGVRLDKPDRCPKFVYDEVMTPCWRQTASERTTFKELDQILSNALAVETTGRIKEEEEEEGQQGHVEDCNLPALAAKNANGE